MKETIAKYISQAGDIRDEHDMDVWRSTVLTYLKEVDSAKARKFSTLKVERHPYSLTSAIRLPNPMDSLPLQLAFLEGVHDSSEPSDADKSTDLVTIQRTVNLSSKRVFVVHGHDNEAKETVSRFIEKIGLEAIVLHEQPNEGLTIIEKFEQHANVAFAVVLLTPDDVGSSKEKTDELQNRARQNVVLELGYFLGLLGRNRVCALHKGDIEIPSDYQGVLYVDLDDAGAWKTKLAQEFVNARIDIDLSGLL